MWVINVVSFKIPAVSWLGLALQEQLIKFKRICIGLHLCTRSQPVGWFSLKEREIFIARDELNPPFPNRECEKKEKGALFLLPDRFETQTCSKRELCGTTGYVTAHISDPNVPPSLSLRR